MNMELSKKLINAREYEKVNMSKADNQRPSFHVTGAIGWINDPNGFSVFEDEYHLFYQYHPYSTQWGPMHWGHVKTRDFIKWERLPVALAPDTSYDKDGCYSGNAIETKDKKHLIMYTGVRKELAIDGNMTEYQHQCIAIGDGIDYEKIEANPVIDVHNLPKGFSKSDFRDPKIWMEEGKYYALVANRGSDGSGALLLFSSEDVNNWSFLTVLDECHNRYGTMWECPDFFELCGKHMLVVSPMEMEAEGLEFHSGNGVIAICGEYNKEKYKFSREWVQSVDYGIDFYAPQTLKTTDGRQIMIGWMKNWATTNLRDDNSPIFGAMTLPRELSIVDNHLVINPVREIENYRINRVHHNASIKNSTSLEGISGRFFDMTVEVKESANYSYFKLTLCYANNRGAYIIYRPKENTVTIDRTLVSKRIDTVQNRSFYVSNKKGKIKFRIIADRDSIELFVNDGEKVATFLVYNDVSEDGILFEADENVNVDVEKYDIKL